MEKRVSINSVIRSFGVKPVRKRFYNVILNGKAIHGIIAMSDHDATKWVENRYPNQGGKAEFICSTYGSVTAT